MANTLMDQMLVLIKEISEYEDGLRKMNRVQLVEEYNNVLNTWAEKWFDDGDFDPEDFDDEDLDDLDLDDEDFDDLDFDDELDDDDFDDADIEALGFDDIGDIPPELLEELHQEIPEFMDIASTHVAEMIKVDKVIALLQSQDPSWNPARAAKDKNAYKMYLTEKEWMTAK